MQYIEIVGNNDNIHGQKKTSSWQSANETEAIK